MPLEAELASVLFVEEPIKLEQEEKKVVASYLFVEVRGRGRLSCMEENWEIMTLINSGGWAKYWQKFHQYLVGW